MSRVKPQIDRSFIGVWPNGKAPVFGTDDCRFESYHSSQHQRNRRLLYVTAPSREEVLRLWFEIHKHIPVDWKDKDKIKAFKNSSDHYAKSWSRLNCDEQGWVCEQISNHHKNIRYE